MEVIKWILCAGLVLYPTFTSQEAQYECGSHGKFEYCIDGIPGCIIGCYCHPGYYFDTESKICEPNAKLTQQYRRNYLPDAAYVKMPHLSLSEEPTPTPTTTTTNPIDKKVEEITKDADDLGDWLYNQFFKTIENQVINKTDRGDLITRRSAKNPMKKKSKRKTRKSRKKPRKKKKNKKGLKNKLLRITEDDSLFDSTFDSSDSEDVSSSDSGFSDSSFSDDSSSSFDSDNDHGHKKFLLYQKAKKPPLPSFIFLPSMGTPFYPPIGLPSPPLPMYPMIPVPPMRPIFPGPNQENTTSAATTTETSTETTTETAIETTTETTTTTESNTNDNESPDNTRTHLSSARKRGRKVHGHNKPWKNGMDHTNMNDNIYEARNTFLQKFGEKIKNKNMKQKLNYLMDEMQEAEQPYDYNIPGESFSFPNHLKPNTLTDEANFQHIPEEAQHIEDVGFKYLSELIHRVDLNNTNMQPDTQYNLSERTAGLPEPQHRRFYNTIPSPNQSPPRINERRLLPKPAGRLEDLYYTNLGRQIASLIRKIDSKGDRQVNIEIEQVDKNPTQPVFRENSFAPRSFWERSVRSPIKYLNSNKYQYLQKSNENLFNLERKVQIYATTKPALSLHELENIINTMDGTTSEIKNEMYDAKSDKTSNMSLNINLLPKVEEAEEINNGRYLHEKYITKANIHNDPTEYFKLNVMHPKLKGIVMNDIHKLNPQVNIRNGSTKIESKLLHQNVKEIKRNSEVLKYFQIPHKRLDNNIYKWFIQPTTNKPIIKHKYNNFDQYLQNSQQNLNNYIKNNNQFMYEHASYPFPKKNGKYIEEIIKPSYFHHEMHHFDFFD